MKGTVLNMKYFPVINTLFILLLKKQNQIYSLRLPSKLDATRLR